jgi:thiamine-monophosphate kinase
LREFELIRWISEHAPAGAGLQTGIGDDCAVLRTPGGEVLVVTTDMLVEGTHFQSGDRPEEIGYKAMAVSISDVAAMGCRSLHAFLAVALPAGFAPSLATGLIDGALAAARRFGVTLAGGDTTASPAGITICSTLVGIPPAGGAPILRSGARSGEVVAVTGRLGGSLAGRHLRFVPRQDEALELVRRFAVGAMIDLSDGLSSDVRHLADRSGVRVRLRREWIPISEEARSADPLASALNDGEDFELLFTVSPEAGLALSREGLCGTPVTVVGEVLPGPAGVSICDDHGRESELAAGGYEHFAR